MTDDKKKDETEEIVAKVDSAGTSTEDGEKISTEIAGFETKIAELTAGWQRTQADFLNHKKQIEQDRARLIKTANADLIETILPVLDNFALAAKHLPKELENNSWAQGVKQIEKQLENVLTNEGLERVESVGKHFDPELHETCEEIDSDRPEGEIVEEISPGYIFHGTVLRPARVKVSRG